jgi:hypothetical protein
MGSLVSPTTVHCSVCSEKTHCMFSLAYIPHRLHSTECNFNSFLSPNLPNNMGDICKILIQNGRRFITHSATISNMNRFPCLSSFWVARRMRVKNWSLFLDTVSFHSGSKTRKKCFKRFLKLPSFSYLINLSYLKIYIFLEYNNANFDRLLSSWCLFLSLVSLATFRELVFY